MSEVHISKIHCTNSRAFRDRTIDGLEPGLNIFIGDNDTGKSTILLALDLALRASVSRIESVGLESLFNRDSILEFLGSDRPKFSDLPTLEVDVYLAGLSRHEFEGPFNAKQEEAYGVCLICRPRDELKSAIDEIICGDDRAFPFEYYSIEFKTFSGAPVFPQRKPLDHLTIDNTKISNDYASRAYVLDVYKANTKEIEQSLHQIKYRQSKENFASEQFDALNEFLGGDASFALKSSTKANLETDQKPLRGPPC